MQYICIRCFFQVFSCIIQIALTKWRHENGCNKLFIDDNLKFTRPSRFDDECTFVRYTIYPYSYGSHSDTGFWKRSCHAYTCEIIHTLSVPSFLRRVKVGFQGFAQAFPSWLRSMERIMHVRSTGCQPIACRPQAPQFPLSMTNRCELPGISKYYYSVINRDEFKVCLGWESYFMVFRVLINFFPIWNMNLERNYIEL